MTMVQAVIQADRAWVVSDSICSSGGGILRGPDGKCYEDAKLIALPHCVITGLGSLSLRHHMERHSHLLTSVDEAVVVLPDILRAGYQALGLIAQGRQLMACIGWSDSHDSMVCAKFTAENDFSAVVHVPIARDRCVFWRSPDIERDPFFSMYPDSLGPLICNAYQTVGEWREKDPQIAIGGALRLATITKDSIVLSIAGDLGVPDPAEKAETMNGKASAIVLGAALAACGGSGEPVEAKADLIADNAATTPLSYFAASTSLSASGAVSASSNVVTPVSGSYVNNYSYTVYLEMFATCEAVVTTPAAGGNWLMQGSYAVLSAGGSTLDARTVGFLTDVSPNPGAISAISYLVALDPGQTFSYSIRGGVGSTSAAVTVAFNNATIRVNVIKK